MHLLRAIEAVVPDARAKPCLAGIQTVGKYVATI